jgi:prevent-host-death family protein
MNALFSDKVVLITELRKNLASYLDQVRNGHPISIVQGNRADVALISRDNLANILEQLEKTRQLVAKLEAQIETYEILADLDLLDKIQRSEDDITQGHFVTLEELQAELGA